MQRARLQCGGGGGGGELSEVPIDAQVEFFIAHIQRRVECKSDGAAKRRQCRKEPD